jgi:hypothetical protein
VTDLEELAEVFDLRCHRCGRTGADTLDDPAALREFLHPEPLTGTARRLERPAQLRTIRQADVERIGRPVHRRCQPGWKAPERRTPPYDLSRSVR